MAPAIPWKDKVKETDFITTELPYEDRKYLGLFTDHVFETNDERIGDIRYYVYDPTKHGYPESGEYPVIYAFHGAGGSLQGKLAVNWAAAEYFASPVYQERMGGAYIICPLANEYKDGEVTEKTWMTPVEEMTTSYSKELLAAMESYFDEIQNEDRKVHFAQILGRNSIYTKALGDLFETVKETFTSAGKTLVFGTSAGGYCAWRYILTYPVDAAILMAAAYLPSEEELERLSKQDIRLWIAHGIYDELVPFSAMVEPVKAMYEKMDNVETYFPEFVRSGNKGVYSNPAGIEMGQHCINNAYQCDLMYDDNTPMDEKHPDGVTGWIKAIIK